MSLHAPSGPDKRADSNEGENRKSSILETLEEQNAALILQLRTCLVRTVLEHGQATIDDVRDLVNLAATSNRMLLGAVPKSLAKAGIISSGGFIKSSRPEAHGRPVTVWKIANREAALRWLQEHSSQSQQPAAAASGDSQQQPHATAFPSKSASAGGQGQLFATDQGYYDR